MDARLIMDRTRGPVANLHIPPNPNRYPFLSCMPRGWGSLCTYTNLVASRASLRARERSQIISAGSSSESLNPSIRTPI